MVVWFWVITATLPVPHPSHANTVCLSACTCPEEQEEDKERRNNRKRKGHQRPQCKLLIHHFARPNFRCKGKETGKGRDEMFSQNDSLLPSTFPQVINEANCACVVFYSTARNSSVSLIQPFWPTIMPDYLPYRWREGRRKSQRERERERGKEGGWRPDRTRPLV